MIIILIFKKNSIDLLSLFLLTGGSTAAERLQVALVSFQFPEVERSSQCCLHVFCLLTVISGTKLRPIKSYVSRLLQKSLLMSYSVWGLEIMNIIAFLCCADNQACCAAKCVENQVCLLFGV